MKITLLIPALVALLGIALASVPVSTQAQTTNTAASTAPVKEKKPAKTQYRGTVTAIDSTSVTIANKEKTLTLALAPTTTYLKDKKPATLADFAVGDRVTGSYTKDATGAMTACSLHTKTAKAVATKTDATTPAPAAAPAAPATQ
jgi:hypothetical protein